MFGADAAAVRTHVAREREWNWHHEKGIQVQAPRLRFGLRQAGAGQVLRTVHNKGYVLDII